MIDEWRPESTSHRAAGACGARVQADGNAPIAIRAEPAGAGNALVRRTTRWPCLSPAPVACHRASPSDRRGERVRAADRLPVGLPARRLRLADRGVVRLGARADLVVFDPLGVADAATYEDPHRYPRGIEQVVVNGRLVVEDGEHTGALPGRVLRPA